MDTQSYAKIFKALCDENRIAIIHLLQSGEKCACKIGDNLGLAQSKLSYHMKILCESKIVQSRCVGKWTHYKLDPHGCDAAFHALNQMLRPHAQDAQEGCRGTDVGIAI